MMAASQRPRQLVYAYKRCGLTLKSRTSGFLYQHKIQSLVDAYSRTTATLMKLLLQRDFRLAGRHLRVLDRIVSDIEDVIADLSQEFPEDTFSTLYKDPGESLCDFFNVNLTNEEDVSIYSHFQLKIKKYHEQFAKLNSTVRYWTLRFSFKLFLAKARKMSFILQQ